MEKSECACTSTSELALYLQCMGHTQNDRKSEGGEGGGRARKKSA